MFWKKSYDFYIGGSMRGCKDLNKPMFALVAHIFREKGFTVWNPAEHGCYLDTSFAECMIDDLNAVINQCNRIALIPGWRNSLGANTEVLVAWVCGKEAVEVILNEDNTDFDLVSLTLSQYRLPYQINDTCRFDPHK